MSFLYLVYKPVADLDGKAGGAKSWRARAYNGGSGGFAPVGSRRPGKAPGYRGQMGLRPLKITYIYNKWLSFVMKIQRISSFPTNS